jgi:hypothetical protein
MCHWVDISREQDRRCTRQPAPLTMVQEGALMALTAQWGRHPPRLFASISEGGGASVAALARDVSSCGNEREGKIV